MAFITLYTYNNVYDYSVDHHAAAYNLVVSEIDLIQYAVSAGGFSNRHVSPAGTQFYTWLIRMALTEGNTFTINDDYSFAETSIKNTLSFFMGMVAAKAIAERLYHIPYLFHLKDPQIEFQTQGRIPDFFGLANGVEPTLLEAKGTTMRKPSNTVIQSAKDQLADIVEIEAVGLGVYHDFYRHVVASGFYDNTLTYYDIDPQPEGSRKILFNIDKAMVSYYQHIIGLLSYGTPKRMSYNNEQYLYTEIGDIKIGLSASIYSYMQRFYLPDGGFLNQDFYAEEINIPIYKDIVSMSRELFTVEKNEKMSLHQDGIICFL